MTESNLPPFGLMPPILATNSKITKTDWRTLAVLVSRWNTKTGRCDPGYPSLSKDIGLPERNIRRSLDHLEALALIRIVPRTNKHGATISNQYDLLFMDGVREVDGVREIDGVRETSAGDVHQTSGGGVRETSAEGVHQTSAPNIEGNREPNKESNRDIIYLGDYPKKKDGERKRDRPKPKPSKGSRIAPDWNPSEADCQYASERGYTDPQIARMAGAFRDHYLALPGQKAVKLDWEATWRNWVRKDIEFNGPPDKRKGAKTTKPNKNQLAG